jgi:RND family efflux transporter MFP subunit
MKTNHLVLMRSVGLLTLACVILGCHRPEARVADLPPPPVSVSQPVVRDVVDHDDYEGRVAAILKVEIRTRARGFLEKVTFKDGEVVDSGKLLFQIDPKPYQTSLDAALAQEKAADASLEFAKSEYARIRKLTAGGAASREELEVWTAKQHIAKSDKLKAQALITQAKTDLGYTQVKAPFAGRLSRTQVNEGALVNSGGGDTLLTTIVTVGPVYVYFHIDERALLRYRRDFRKKRDKNSDGPEPTVAELKIPLHVALEGEAGHPHTGVIDYADPKVDAGTGTLEVRGRLPNTSGLLQDGMRARVRVPVSNPYKTMLITERAIGNEQGRKFVYVVTRDNVVERRDVLLDRVIDGMQVVRAGLKADDRVIVSGIQRVREGIEVKPKEVPMPDTAQASASPQAPRKGKE